MESVERKGGDTQLLSPGMVMEREQRCLCGKNREKGLRSECYLDLKMIEFSFLFIHLEILA